MNPYPWTATKRFPNQSSIGETLADHVAPALSGIASVLSFPSWGWRLWTREGFERANDSWLRRGLVVFLIGVVWTVLAGFPGEWAHAAKELIYAFGDKQAVPWNVAVQHMMIAGFGPATLLQGVAGMCHSYDYEYTSRRYLAPTRPGLRVWWRRRKNTRMLAAGDVTGHGLVPFGLIEQDHIPWRSPRLGMLAERAIARLGHGLVLGASGTGKTVLVENVAYYYTQAGGAVVYIDCKASLSTLNAMRGVAAAANVPFHCFDLGIGSGVNTWYPLLDWDGKPAEKASMLMQAFEFADAGGAVFYRGAAEAWLPIQMDVLAAVGVRPGEGAFDFLLATSSPAGLRDRISVWRGDGDPEHARLYTAWEERAKGVDAKNLTGLRNNIERVINGAGDRLRPPTDPRVEAVSIRTAAKEGGVVYIGLSASTDLTTLKTVGSLAIRDMSALAGARQRVPDKQSLRPILCGIDEASQLGDRAVVVENLLATAREGKVAAWIVTQTLGSWPDSTKGEILTNVSTFAAFRVQDPEEATPLAQTLGTMPVREVRVHETTQTRMMQEDVVSAEETGQAILTRAPYLRADELLNVPDRHFYLWFRSSPTHPTRKPYVNKRVGADEIAGDAPLVQAVRVSAIAAAADDTFDPTPDAAPQHGALVNPNNYPYTPEPDADAITDADEQRRAEAGTPPTTHRHPEEPPQWVDDTPDTNGGEDEWDNTQPATPPTPNDTQPLPKTEHTQPLPTTNHTKEDDPWG